MNAKKKRIVKTILLSGFLIFYLLGFIFIINSKQIFGIGYYYDEKDFDASLGVNSGGINLNIYANHYQNTDHNYGFKITLFSSTNVDVIGICYLSLRFGTSMFPKLILNMNYTTPLKFYAFENRGLLLKNDNLTCKGFADVIFNINSVNETHRINLDLGIIIRFSGSAISYNWTNFFIWIEVLYFIFLILPVSLLYRNISTIRFNRWHTEEMKERDEIFLKILEERDQDL